MLHHVPHVSGVTVHVDPTTESGETSHHVGGHAHDGLPVHTHPWPEGTAVAQRRLVMVILIALGLSALVGLLGSALLMGPAFLDWRGEQRIMRTVWDRRPDLVSPRLDEASYSKAGCSGALI